MPSKAIMAEHQRNWYYRHKNEDGRIYRIYNVVTGDEYIGCTTNSLNKRLNQAKAAVKAGRKDLLTQNIRAWGPECFEIELLEEGYPGNPVFERESEYISDRAPNLNKNLFKY